MPTPSNKENSRSKKGESERKLSLAARHEWAVVGILAILVLLFGCIGFAQTLVFEDRGGEYTRWDILYNTLRLFILEGPDATAGWPIHLHLARVLAPLILIYSAATAIWYQVDYQVKQYLLMFRKRRFVVVCGIGETGFRLAREYLLNSDKYVVVIDNSPMNPLTAELVNLGALLVKGNAIDPIVLHQARVVCAKELFLCTGDEQANIAIAKNVERLARRLSDREVARMARIASRHEPWIGERQPYLGLRCFLNVDAPDLYEVFTNHPFFATRSERYAIRIFNRRETVARNVFSRCAPDMYYRPEGPESNPAHILFLGFDALTRELILQAALTAHYPDFRVPRMTVMCPPDADDLVERFFHRYPQLLKTAEIELVFADPLTVGEARWNELQQSCHFTVCYVAMAKDVESILAARRLNRIRRLADFPKLHFVVLLNQQTFLAEILDDNFLPIDDDKSSIPEHEPIEYFETLDETITIGTVVNETLDALAETLHMAYLQSQMRQGETLENNPSVVHWSDLPPHKKKANQHAAAHMDVKLRIAGCARVAEGDERPAVDFPPSEAMLDLLAQLEHRRWMADKYLAGYSYGPQRDDDRMLHPDLITWDELTESDKDKDRQNIVQVPHLADMRGEKICRAES